MTEVELTQPPEHPVIRTPPVSGKGKHPYVNSMFTQHIFGNSPRGRVMRYWSSPLPHVKIRRSNAASNGKRTRLRFGITDVHNTTQTGIIFQKFVPVTGVPLSETNPGSPSSSTVEPYLLNRWA
ncbi:MAG: hypothetical protein CM1200mP14_09770 [Gammaproteobacteria bacterium]|nr:MAG: hypothetical protein CM1200mP14_09770 [Gammaproteobacteria bacterium]